MIIMSELVSVSEWARTLGISRQAAHAALRRVAIPVVNGKIDAVRATAAYNATTRQRVRTAGRTRTSAPTDHMSYDEARRRQAAADATRAEVELAVRLGELVRASDVRAAVGPRLIAARDRLLNISARVAPLLAVETDAAIIAGLIDVEIHQALAELSRAADTTGGGHGRL